MCAFFSETALNYGPTCTSEVAEGRVLWMGENGAICVVARNLLCSFQSSLLYKFCKSQEM